jgi:hypothetical protein
VTVCNTEFVTHCIKRHATDILPCKSCTHALAVRYPYHFSFNAPVPVTVTSLALIQALTGNWGEKTAPVTEVTPQYSTITMINIIFFINHQLFFQALSIHP